MIKKLIAVPFAAVVLYACSSDDTASRPVGDAGTGDAAIGDGATPDGATGDASGGDGGSSGVPTCTDGAKNGGETDVDCGGTCAARCAVGKACAVSADCTSGTCGATKPCVAAPALCKIDGFSWVAAQNKYLVIAKGKAWWLDGSNALVGAGIDLYTLPGLASGPCAGQVGDCRIDAMAYRNDGNQVYIFRGSHVWVLNENIAPVSDFEFTQIPGLVNGPCAAQIGGACRIDSASYNSDANLLQVTVGGTFWDIQGTTFQLAGPVAGTPLTSIVDGTAICTGLGAGCVLDDFAWRVDTKSTEFIGNGRRWVLDANLKLVAGTGNLLTDIPGFAQGPCQ